MKLRVGLVYDLRSEYLREGYSPEEVAEFDSDETIEALERAIRGLGHRPVRIGHARALAGRLAAGERWDLVFNFAEGVEGRARECQAPCLLDIYGIPYTMSDPVTHGVGLDKALSKIIVRSAGLRTPAFHVVRVPADTAKVRLRYPLFVKPLAEGTGKGVDTRSMISNCAALNARCAALLKRHRQPVLVEEYLPGREFTVGILGTGSSARVLGLMEVMVNRSLHKGIYSYESKEHWEKFVKYAVPPRGALRTAIEKLALESHRALEARDCSRIDIRLDGAGKPSFIEINTLPGLHPTHSDLPIIATLTGMKFKRLIGEILKSALKREKISRRDRRVRGDQKHA
jgi:D-alanine-D-alanine ligase